MDEDELKAKIADLTRRLADAEAALGAAQAELRKLEAVIHRNERLETLGSRADAVAHDLNNVFAPILMAVALLKEKVSDDKAMRMLTVLETNAERGAALVRLVRDFGPGDEDSPLRKPPPPLPLGGYKEQAAE
jgi:signal transduction histidine kinase